MPFRKLPAADKVLVFREQVRILANHVGTAQAGHVEGLAGRHVGDGVHAGLFGNSGEYGVPVAGKGQIRMDFIRNDQRAVCRTDFSHAAQFLRTPYAASGVVGIAQDEHAAATHGFLHVVEVHAVAAVFQNEGIVDDFPAVFPDDHGKGVVHRRLDHDFVPRFRKALDGAGNAGNNARSEAYFRGVHLPPVASVHPVPDGFKESAGLDGISQDFVLATAADSFHDEGGRPEVHVRHPQGNQVVPAPAGKQRFIFQGSGAASLNYFVKIVLHGRFVWRPMVRKEG